MADLFNATLSYLGTHYCMDRVTNHKATIGDLQDEFRAALSEAGWCEDAKFPHAVEYRGSGDKHFQSLIAIAKEHDLGKWNFSEHTERNDDPQPEFSGGSNGVFKRIRAVQPLFYSVFTIYFEQERAAILYKLYQ